MAKHNDLSRRIRKETKHLEDKASYKPNTADATIENYIEGVEIWEQQVGVESDKDYELFKEHYLLASPEKQSYRCVAEATGRGLPAIASKGGKKKWVERSKAFREWSRTILKRRIQYRLEQDVDNLFGRIEILSKMIDTGLEVGVETSQIKNHLYRTYALEKLVKIEEMIKSSLIDIVDGKFRLKGADIQSQDGGVIIKFIKSSDKDEDE